MNNPAQDTDSGAGQVVTPGQPVQHVDMEDGQSVGQFAEPPAEGTPPTADDVVPATPPPKQSLDEIYGNAQTGRAAEIETELEGMTDAERMHYDRMVAEAGGGDDPFADPPAAPEAGAQPPIDPNQPALAPEIAPQGIDTNAELTTITVYGMQEQVPTADVVASGGLEAFQKTRAADVRLQRLTTYEASLRGWEDQLSERAAVIERTPQPPAADGTGITEPSPTDAQGSNAGIDALSEVMTEAIYSGDRDEAKTKIAQVLTTISADATRAAQESVAQSMPTGPTQQEQNDEALARQQANAVFSQEYGDLNTPVLKQAALNMVQEVARDPVMIGRPLAEITREACGRIREDVYGTRDAPAGYVPNVPAAGAPANPLIPPANPGPPTDLALRHDLKRRTVVTPLNEAHGRSPAPPNEQQQFPNNSAFVSQLRKGRGQPA